MREENKTNCDPFHCEVQGRGFCNSNLKRGATERHSQRTGFVTDSQPQPPPGAVPQAAGGTIPRFLQEQFPATIMGKAARLDQLKGLPDH